MRLSVPDLHDEVIGLRPPRRSDVDAITAAVQDPDIPAFTMVPTPYAVEDAIAYVERTAASWRAGSAAGFVIANRATGELLGARGRGVASRALGLVADWTLETVGLARLEALVFVENERSHRVAVRAGFERGPVARARIEHHGRRRDVIVWSRDASIRTRS